MAYQLIVFDWDGTLYDSGAYIVDCFQAATSEVGIETPTSEAIRDLIGLSLEEVLKRLMSQTSQEKREQFIQAYRNHINQKAFNEPLLFNGAKSVLEQLREEGYQLAIATGKCREGLNDDLIALELYDLFHTTRCADETQSKPHPQMLLEIIEELEYQPHQVLMVGDTEYDIQLARNAKIDALAVNYGMHDEDRLLRNLAKDCISDIRDLPDWLKIQL